MTTEVSTSVMQKELIQKGKSCGAHPSLEALLLRALRLLKREFRNPLGSDKKQSMFHNPFFVDLAEGSAAHRTSCAPRA